MPNIVIVNQMAELRTQGYTWAAIADTLDITISQVNHLAHYVRHRPRALPIPRGVPTLPRLPSLDLPLYIIKTDV